MNVHYIHPSTFMACITLYASSNIHDPLYIACTGKHSCEHIHCMVSQTLMPLVHYMRGITFIPHDTFYALLYIALALGFINLSSSFSFYSSLIQHPQLFWAPPNTGGQMPYHCNLKRFFGGQPTGIREARMVLDHRVSGLSWR